MQINETIPKDAAAVILLREESEEVYLAQRNPALKFLGGYHAFPGGKTDAEDAEIEVENCADADLKRFIVCAVRETFEEIGVLLVRGADKITKGQRASLRDDLISGRFSFAEILRDWNFTIDAAAFHYTGFWTTPKFSPVRFKTRFFAAVCPRRQEPETFDEFVEGAFTAPAVALDRWEKSEILISPPVLISLQILEETLAAEKNKSAQVKESVEKSKLNLLHLDSSPRQVNYSKLLPKIVKKLLAASQETGGEIRYIKLNPHITLFPVRTETLPPATHTNCFIIGGREFVVIDPASPFIDEQRALDDYIGSLIENGNVCREIILTHLHKDHISGANTLQKHIHERFRKLVPIAAHRATAESIKNSISVGRFIEDNEIIKLKLNNEETLEIRALHTPGHARGHLCFYDDRHGFLLSGDNVVGTGSVLIASPEGNMKDYLASLERIRDLPNLRFLCGSHGAAIYDGRGKIENYIAHRLEREHKILEAIRAGATTTQEIVERVYRDVPEKLWGLAEKSVEAHLEKIRAENLS